MNARGVSVAALALTLAIATVDAEAQSCEGPCVGPARGALIAAGGGALDERIYEEFVRRAGGAEARIVLSRVRTLLDEKMPDEKALMEAAGAGSDVARETRRLRLRTSLRVRALLTKEQLEKFMELRSNTGRPGA